MRELVFGGVGIGVEVLDLEDFRAIFLTLVQGMLVGVYFGVWPVLKVSVFF